MMRNKGHHVRENRTQNSQALEGFVWSIAEILRGDFKQSEYGKVVLPFVVLRRLDCILDPPTAKDAKLHECFRSLIGPEHYCYHSEGSVGRAFLRRHQNLL